MKKLIIVCEERLRKYGDFLAQLISGTDDKEGNVIGIEDGAAAAQVWSEKEYSANAAQISSEQYLLFIGNSPLIKGKRHHMLQKYSEHGMNYGWLGKQAVLFVDHILSYTEYEKIDEDDKALNIYVSGPEKVNKRKMYNYDYIGQLTMMYSAKHFGLIQIKDIKKNNDYAIRLQLFKKPDTEAHLLKENLAKYRIRKKSSSHDKLSKKLKSHYDLFHMCDEKPAIVALWYSCWNMWFGLLKKRNYEKSF